MKNWLTAGLALSLLLPQTAAAAPPHPAQAAATVYGWVYKQNAWYYYEPGSRTPHKGWLRHMAARSTDPFIWYYLDTTTGAMRTGWLNDGGTWYYLDKQSGAMKRGWVQDGDKWYYLMPDSGAMKTGWLLWSGRWYYLQADGSMKTGWLLDKGHWYYLNSGGDMQSGWKQVGEDVFYFDKKTGIMAANQQVDGTLLGPDGNWLSLSKARPVAEQHGLQAQVSLGEPGPYMSLVGEHETAAESRAGMKENDEMITVSLKFSDRALGLDLAAALGCPLGREELSANLDESWNRLRVIEEAGVRVDVFREIDRGWVHWDK